MTSCGRLIITFEVYFRAGRISDNGKREHRYEVGLGDPSLGVLADSDMTKMQDSGFKICTFGRCDCRNIAFS